MPGESLWFFGTILKRAEFDAIAVRGNAKGTSHLVAEVDKSKSDRRIISGGWLFLKPNVYHQGAKRNLGSECLITVLTCRGHYSGQGAVVGEELANQA